MTLEEAHAGGSWARRLLRSQMTLRGVSYRELEVRLRDMGIIESEVNLRNKINRGLFPAFFFLQCLNAMGVRELDVPSWAEFIKEHDDRRAKSPKVVKVPGGYLRYDPEKPDAEPVFLREPPRSRAKRQPED
jgi:Domain of unknown function (DUF6471)